MHGPEKKLSKVVTTRIPLYVFAGCYDMLEKAGAKTDMMPYSTVISKTLQGFIEAQLRSGELPRYKSNEELVKRLQRYMEISEDDDLPTANAGAGFVLPDADPEDAPYPVSANPNAINQAVEMATTGYSEQPLEVNPNPERPPKEHPNIDWNLVRERTRLFWDDIAAEVPLDSLVEDTEEEDWRRKFAIEIVYSNTPKDKWGSDEAAAAVADMLQLMEETNLQAKPNSQAPPE